MEVLVKHLQWKKLKKWLIMIVNGFQIKCVMQIKKQITCNTYRKCEGLENLEVYLNI